MQQKVKENSKKNIYKCKTTHHGIKCEKCLKEPIYGYRYKCSQCRDYNLCQDCEEKISFTGEHPHYFMKIIKEEKNNEIEEYSFECLNKNNLNREINQDEKEIKIDIIMKNNKNKTWPENDTKLVLEINSHFFQNEIKLLPQKFDEIKNYEIVINNLDDYPPGNYIFYLRFEVNGKQFGERIEISLVIKEKPDEKYIALNYFARLLNDFSIEKYLALLK